MEIDERAPVVTRAEVVVAAPPEVVWAVHTDIDAWPGWHPDITRAELRGPLEPGSTILWRAGSGKITTTLVEVEPPRRITWTGRAMGVRAIHVWTFEPTDDSTRVATEESLDGWPVNRAGVSRPQALSIACRTVLRFDVSSVSAPDRRPG